MHKFLIKHGYGLHNVLVFLFILLLIIMFAFFSLAVALIALVIAIALFIYFEREQKAAQKELKQHQETLAYRVKKTGDDVISNFPIGILLYNEKEQVEWCNVTLLKMSGQSDIIGHAITDVAIGLDEIDLKQTDKQRIDINERVYEVSSYPEERLLYIEDVTEYETLLATYQREQIAIGIIHMDNYDEVVQGMDDQQRSFLSSQITKMIAEWADKYQIFIRRHTADKFLVFFNHGILQELIQSRFDILDIVRSYSGDNKIPITLSIGVATGVESLVEMGRLTQTSLDIALGRGGDQAAVREGTKLTFYGGKTNAIEKRTRVRARVISHAMRDLIRESDQVIILGHAIPDMDAIGAALGVLRAVMINDQIGYIVLDKPNPSIEKLMKLVDEHETLHEHIITPEAAVNIITPKTLLVVVDTHRPSLTIEPRLVQLAKRVVVLDHHRRAEEIIEDAVIYYIEPYASSTSELVVELLNYQDEQIQLDPLEATALLAGIVVDTRSFTFRTGARTFEAASLLRRWGADSILVQKLLKEDMEQFQRRSKLVADADITVDSIAITTGGEDEIYDQVLIAQAADTLLDMDGVKGSFVIAKRADGQIVISARSLGEINVQVIMEAMGGGGHLTNAATQLKNTTISEAKEQLLHILQENEGSVDS